MLAQSLGVNRQVAMQLALADSQKAADELDTANEDKKKTAAAVIKAEEPADAKTAGTDNNTKLVEAQAADKAQGLIVDAKKKARMTPRRYTTRLGPHGKRP